MRSMTLFTKFWHQSRGVKLVGKAQTNYRNNISNSVLYQTVEIFFTFQVTSENNDLETNIS